MVKVVTILTNNLFHLPQISHHPMLCEALALFANVFSLDPGAGGGTEPSVHLPNRTAAEGAGPVAPLTWLLSNVLSVSFHSPQPALLNRPPRPIVGGAAVTYHALVRDFGDGRHRGSNWMSQSSTAALWRVRGAWRWDATGKWGFLKVSGAGREFGMTHTIPVGLCCSKKEAARVMHVDSVEGWVGGGSREGRGAGGGALHKR